MNLWLLVRTTLYAVLAVSSFLTWVLAAAFIGKTESEFDTYYGSTACLLASGLLAFFTLPVLHFMFHRRGKASMVGSLAVELAVVFVLWALFLGGAAGMADRLPGLSSTYCDSSVCSLGRSVEAFAWISWVMLTFLLVGLITFGALGHKRRGSGVWKEPFSVDAGTGHAAGTGATEKGVGHTAAAPPAAAPPTTAAPAPGANYNETRPAEVTAV
ncbi:Proteophosphoglycan ppg4 [Rhodotorula diobovata]|uniref:Proteophosphoglycan ppg4 n=1 Tax=Rhodotorula diobovata TaxID=5288 RepID=A0A5C5G6D5_9BASI|nr:Proteophosphoglycan ppg4 [Rhodotorula diobovata]